jgi:hypothetical protein
LAENYFVKALIPFIGVRGADPWPETQSDCDGFLKWQSFNIILEQITESRYGLKRIRDGFANLAAFFLSISTPETQAVNSRRSMWHSVFPNG